MEGAASYDDQYEKFSVILDREREQRDRSFATRTARKTFIYARTPMNVGGASTSTGQIKSMLDKDLPLKKRRREH